MRPQSSIPPRFQAVRLCACGCGQPTLLATKTRRGHAIHQPMPYLRNHMKRGRRAPHYQGVKRSHGYIRRHVPDHPFADKRGYVFEHRLVAEQTIGRYLRKDEVVHHLNRITDDNRPENLAVMTMSEHAKLHHPGKTKLYRHGRWSLHYDRCIACGLTERPFRSAGMCDRCHGRWWQKNKRLSALRTV